MKNIVKLHFLSIINIYILLTMLSVYGQAYVYHPFPDTNAIWNAMGYNSFTGYPLDDLCYGLKGDTIINGKTYKKIFSLFDSTLDLLHNSF